VKKRILEYWLITFCLVVSSSNVAAGYTLTRIIDDSGQFFSFSAPSINNNGTVTYQATLDTFEEGIYTGSGQPVVVSSGSFFLHFGNPSLNDNAAVVYTAELVSGGSGVFTGAGTRVSDDSGKFLSFGQAVINNQGVIAYNAKLDTLEEGIYTGTGQSIVDSSGLFNSFSVPSINDSGQIAFSAVLDDGSSAIYVATPDIPDTPVDLGGSVETAGGTGLCALVLASGKFDFSCNPDGPFSLTGLARQSDASVKRQVYADGFFPVVDTLSGSVDETVVLTPSGNCPDYNIPYAPTVTPGSAGKLITISGDVRLQGSQTPVCAIVLANGQFMFSCDGSGSYAMTIPLDNNGQYKLQVYADGFAPSIQQFDESMPATTVRMTRASECQVP
jgi:hypothetical protein